MKSSPQQERFSYIQLAVFFFIGLSQALKVELGGQLSGFEFVSLAGAVIALIYPPEGGWPLILKRLLFAVAIWFLIQLLTDLALHISPVNMAKGVARIVTFGAALMFFWRFVIPNGFYLGGFLIGLGLSYIASFYMYNEPEEVAEPWKWCWGPAATFCLIGILGVLRVNYKLVWRGVLIGLGLIHFFFNFRSFGAICLFSGLIPVGWSFVRPIPVVIRVVAAIGGVVFVAWGYGILASNGMIGEAAREKYAMQAREGLGTLSYFSGGRPEYRASIKAISQSPIVGYGSWAQHPEFVYELWDPEKGDFDARRLSGALELGIIPSHSHLFGAWVDGGILPALFWVCLWGYSFVQINKQDWSLWAVDAMVLMFGLGLLWSILFSPFGTGNRLMTALSICILFRRCTQFSGTNRVAPSQRPLPASAGSRVNN